ncbi:MAG: hypothetical protein HZA49_09905 [Planctomycetes bacterium]|nr:hypothetical protein [Planctomycetota bacterium]
MRHILIVAGEASGDLHASNLVRALKSSDLGFKISDLKFSGLGGAKMQEAGVELLTPFTKNAGTGLDPLLKITHFSQVFRKLVSYASHGVPPGQALSTSASKTSPPHQFHWCGGKPDLAILVDFPDFNLRLAPRLKQLGIKVVYYISPQIWAWRQSRVKIIQKYVDKMIVIFGFEQEFYNRFNVAAEFVGHPLLDVIENRNLDSSRFRRDGNDMRNDARHALGLGKDDLVIGLLPGSRPSEFKRHFPIMQKAIQILSKTTSFTPHLSSPQRGEGRISEERIGEGGNIKYILGAAPDITPAIISKMSRPTNTPLPARLRSGGNPLLLEGTSGIIPFYNKTYEVIAASDILITVSGTITVEAALFQTPMIVIYKVPLLTELVFRPLVKTPFYAMVNIIANKKVVPELIQQDCTPAKIAQAVTELLDPDARNRMKEELGKVKAKLGSAGASQRAAEIIHKILNS